MKILQIMECTIGGTRRHIRELSCGLCHRGHDVTAVCSAERDPTFRGDMETMRAAGVEVVELPMRRAVSPLADFRHLAFLYRFLGTHPFDVIHTHSSKAGVLGRVAGLCRGRTPLVHTPHTFAFAFKDHFSPVKRRFFLAVERLLGARTGRMINVSESERREALSYRVIRPGRIAVVPNGIDPWPFRWAEPPERSAFGGRRFSPRLGTVGLLNAAKGHDVLLHAFKKLLEQHPEAGLVIVGEGELREPLSRLIEALGLQENAFLAGFRDDVPEVMKELDLFVLPSLWEGMPYVVMEAMASGVPVVVTNVNGSRDIVEHEKTGLIAPPGDAGALAEACEAVLSAPDLGAAMAREGIGVVLRRYTVARMVERIERVYLDLTGRGA
jgi:glycosyltransferase involved in cell wall biosynthesis